MKLSTKITLITFILVLVGVGTFARHRFNVHQRAEDKINEFLRNYPHSTKVKIQRGTPGIGELIPGVTKLDGVSSFSSFSSTWSDSLKKNYYLDYTRDPNYFLQLWIVRGKEFSVGDSEHYDIRMTYSGNEWVLKEIVYYIGQGTSRTKVKVLDSKWDNVPKFLRDELQK